MFVPFDTCVCACVELACMVSLTFAVPCLWCVLTRTDKEGCQPGGKDPSIEGRGGHVCK